MQQPHSYSAAPQAAPLKKNKTKYRDEGGDENIDMGNNINSLYIIYIFIIH
jgi:hypothetical protein